MTLFGTQYLSNFIFNDKTQTFNYSFKKLIFFFFLFKFLIGRLGGDSKLTPRGEEFAKKLGEYVNQLKHPNFKTWTSWLRRTIDTAKYIDFDQER